MKKTLSIFVLIALLLTLTACGGKKEESAAPAAPVDLKAVMESFNLGEEMMTLEISELNDLYFMGFDLDEIKQAAVAMHTSGINADEIIMIETVSPEAAGRVKEILEGRYQEKLNQMENYIPEQYAMIKECSVTVNGNFVAMIVAPNASELVAIYNKSIQ